MDLEIKRNVAHWVTTLEGTRGIILLLGSPVGGGGGAMAYIGME